MNKTKVYELYDIICDWYDDARTKSLMEKEYLELIRQHVEDKASILDLGCGTGEPIAAYFIQHGYQVTGVDAAKSMLAKCESRFPDAEWVLEDMRLCSLGRKFNAILAWDSFFHLPHDDQRAMFSVFQEHAEKDAILIFTSGPDYGEVVGTMDGQDFYHASLGTEEYQSLLKDHGFKVLLHRIEDENCGGHTVWVAQYSL